MISVKTEQTHEAAQAEMKMQPNTNHLIVGKGARGTREVLLPSKSTAHLILRPTQRHIEISTKYKEGWI